MVWWIAVVTVTDGDGDVDVDEFRIGDKLKFDDDGPLADIADGFGMVTVARRMALTTTTRWMRALRC